MEVYGAVRRYVLLEGHSRREAARVFGLSRDTVAKMCRFSVPPGYQRSKPPEKRKRSLKRASRRWAIRPMIRVWLGMEMKCPLRN